MEWREGLTLAILASALRVPTASKSSILTICRTPFDGVRTPQTKIVFMRAIVQNTMALIKTILAEREGFEPPEPARTQRFSRPPLSTTQPSLQLGYLGPVALAQPEYYPLHAIRSMHFSLPFCHYRNLAIGEALCYTAFL